MMRSPGKVDMRGLVGAFREYWGPALPYLPDACRVPEDGGWLASITRTHRKAFHPLLHVMLERFLLDAPLAPARAAPFGHGPWPCRNVLAAHHGRPVPMDVAMHRQRYGEVGTFICGCGYSYTRAARRDGSIGPPRLASPGPLLEPALRRLVVPGARLRAVARATGLDPKTVVREALAIGIEVPWSTMPSGRPRTYRPANRRASRRRRSHGGATRRDWDAHDRDLVDRLRLAARAIATAVPPVRAGRSELERRVARVGYFTRRSAKLPRSSALLGLLAEDVETFQRRRVRYWIERMGGDARPWWVMRAAGLKGDRLRLVEEELARVR